MSWKSTLLLILLASAAGAWCFLGDEIAPQIGIKPANPEPPSSVAVGALDGLKADDIVAVSIAFPTGEPLELSRADAKSPWKMPGNWPLRAGQVRELLDTLANLRTRFHAKNAAIEELEQYGLAPDQKPLAVTLRLKKIDANGQPRPEELTLYFGDPKPGEDHTAFTRPAYVRNAVGYEVLTLGPDVMPVLRRSAESYRRRQLFLDVERVRVVGVDAPATITLPGEETEAITVQHRYPRVFGLDLTALSTFTLRRTGKLPEPGVLPRGAEPALPVDRIADAWALAAPHPDPAEPAKLRPLLAAVADLWVEAFMPVEPAGAAIVLPILYAVPPDIRMGFAPAKRSVTFKPKGSDEVTVEFGGVARKGERDELVTVPGGPPGSPPQTITQKVPTEYRYARLQGNPQVFIVPADKFDDLFVWAAEVTDTRVARFEPEEVREVVLKPATGDPIKLVLKKGDPAAKQDDQWFIDATPNPLLAESSRVNELVRKLTAMQTDSRQRREYPQTVRAAQTTITITARERRADREPDAPTRTYTLEIAKPDAVTNLLPVRLADQPRVSLVDNRLGPDQPDSWLGALLFPDTLSAFLERPALAYRNLKLLDSGGGSLDAVQVAGAFSLARTTEGWRMISPITSEADAVKSDQLAASLTGLRAAEFLKEKTSAGELKTFGLEKPAHTITLAFSKGRKYTLELGAPRPGKPEVFARLDGGDVFALPNATAEQLTTGAVGLLPLKVWGTSLDKVTSLEVARTGDDAKESLKLAKDGGDWKLTAPFAAPVPKANLQSLAALANITAVRYQTLAVANPAEFGLDKPFLTVKVAYLEQKPGETTETPVTRTVIVGGPTADGRDRYARLDVPNAPVFIVGPEFLFAAQTRPLNLLDRALLSLDPSQVAKVRVTPAKAEDAYTLAKDDKGKWAAEGASYAVDPERIRLLTATAARLQVMRLVAYGDAIKWADFGLEKPANTVTVTLSGDKPVTHTIALGSLDPTGSRFIRVDDKPAVGVIDAPDAETLVREKFEYADRTLLTFDSATLMGLSRIAGKDELEIAQGAAVGWDIVKPAKQKADQPFVDELAEALGRLKAVRVAAYGKKDEVFKQYGLDQPAAALTLTVGEKAEQKTLRIGNPVDAAKPDGDRYAAVDSAAPEVIVGVLPAALASKLLAPHVAFRDHTLARFVDADKVVLERGDRKITFAKTGVTWKITEPLATAAESASLDALVADLGKVRVDTWVAEKGQDLKPFGLDKPEAKWTILYDDKPVLTLLIGKKTADGRVYVATDKGELVGLLDAARSDRVLAEYRQRKPWDVDAAQVEAIDIAVGESKFTLAKAGTVWVDLEKPGDAIDARVVNELLGTLGGLRLERYAADKDADPKLFGLEKPEATLTVNSPTGKRMLEIGGAVGGTDGKQRYARVADKDRTDVFILGAADTTRLTRDRGMYLLKK